MDNDTMYEALRNLLGGAATTVVAALAGRMMYHTSEVKKKNRKFFGRELVWELPVAFGMGLVGEGVAAYMELSETVGVALIVALAYLGPRGIEVAFEKRVKKYP